LKSELPGSGAFEGRPGRSTPISAGSIRRRSVRGPGRAVVLRPRLPDLRRRLRAGDQPRGRDRASSRSSRPRSASWPRHAGEHLMGEHESSKSRRMTRRNSRATRPRCRRPGARLAGRARRANKRTVTRRTAVATVIAADSPRTVLRRRKHVWARHEDGVRESGSPTWPEPGQGHPSRSARRRWAGRSRREERGHGRELEVGGAGALPGQGRDHRGQRGGGPTPAVITGAVGAG